MKTERDGDRDFYPLLKIVNNLDHMKSDSFYYVSLEQCILNRVSCLGGNSYRPTAPTFSIVPGVISHLTRISVFGQDEMLNPI